MKIFIASSWKNRPRVRMLAINLRKLNHDVFDFTDQDRRMQKICPPEKFPPAFDPESIDYYEYLTGVSDFRLVVEENKSEIEKCDLVILLLPCGIDATADWAYGVGKGKKSIILGRPNKGERSFTHLWADCFVDTETDLLRSIKSMDAK